jgi:hypothetical protein
VKADCHDLRSFHPLNDGCVCQIVTHSCVILSQSSKRASLNAPSSVPTVSMLLNAVHAKTAASCLAWRCLYCVHRCFGCVGSERISGSHLLHCSQTRYPHSVFYFGLTMDYVVHASGCGILLSCGRWKAAGYADGEPPLCADPSFHGTLSRFGRHDVQLRNHRIASS